jgi:hypothetical protein
MQANSELKHSLLLIKFASNGRVLLPTWKSLDLIIDCNINDRL